MARIGPYRFSMSLMGVERNAHYTLSERALIVTIKGWEGHHRNFFVSVQHDFSATHVLRLWLGIFLDWIPKTFINLWLFLFCNEVNQIRINRITLINSSDGLPCMTFSTTFSHWFSCPIWKICEKNITAIVRSGQSKRGSFTLRRGNRLHQNSSKFINAMNGVRIYPLIVPLRLLEVIMTWIDVEVKWDWHDVTSTVTIWSSIQSSTQVTATVTYENG